MSPHMTGRELTGGECQAMVPERLNTPQRKQFVEADHHECDRCVDNRRDHQIAVPFEENSHSIQLRGVNLRTAKVGNIHGDSFLCLLRAFAGPNAPLRGTQLL